MKNELNEYSEAFNAHIEAQRSEMLSKIEIKATHYRLMRAKEALKIRERELLEDVERS